MVFYDLGANIGFFFVDGGSNRCPEGRVISFEADPEIAPGFGRIHAQSIHHAHVEQKRLVGIRNPSLFERVAPNTSPIAASPCSPNRSAPAQSPSSRFP